MTFLVRPIGQVRSSLTELSQCPNQGSEGAPEAWIEIDPEFSEATDGLQPGSDIVVFTWMHLAERSVLRVHPQKNESKPMKGVFATRSPARPNPIGLHLVTILKMESTTRFLVSPLEALDETPVIDIKIARTEDTWSNTSLE
jgi:tRNA-Thr(GGU) m(6)t(6)A37 methyltransferase TsaA